MARILTENHPVCVPCPHCGMWHCASSSVDETTARRFAAKAMERCRKLRELHRLPDEGPPQERPEAAK